jgi:hypothetical protein
MSEQPRHEMQLDLVHPSGAEEWACLECGRRFVAQWEPKFRRVILEYGDEITIHTGQGINPQAQVSANLNDDNDIELNDVWKQLLDKLDFDSDGDNNLSD